ncbi:hypothetical protein T05_742 [Trichinella murrelli]|uniref:Uncharacterized protein n=1 Tax=Trichinella murrelli TaxID=144512 RepID=A0A0V0SWM9_9BILA|nr:hypothetical protein T05_742 [Trichinella murrelli]
MASADAKKKCRQYSQEYLKFAFKDERQVGVDDKKVWLSLL